MDLKNTSKSAFIFLLQWYRKDTLTLCFSIFDLYIPYLNYWLIYISISIDLWSHKSISSFFQPPPLLPYTQKSKYWTGYPWYLFLLDITYKKYLNEPSHENYLQLKVLEIQCKKCFHERCGPYLQSCLWGFNMGKLKLHQIPYGQHLDRTFGNFPPNIWTPP